MKFDTKLDRIRKLLAGPAADRAVSQALALLEEDPSNGEPVRMVADYYASNNQHEVVLMLADAYETRFQPTLGYDPWAADFMRAVSGYYSKIPGAKQASAQINDELSLDAGIDHGRRVAARNNLEWYAPSLGSLVGEFDLKQITLALGDGYMELNPSICIWNGEPWMVQRTVNYLLNDDGNYMPVVDDNIRTRNWLCRLDPSTLAVVEARAIEMPVDWPRAAWPLVLGFEDSRLFVNNNQLWTSSTVRELAEDGRAQIVLARIELIEDGTCRLVDWQAIEPKHTTPQYEKNWMPVVGMDKICWLYACEPARVINSRGETTAIGASIIATDHWKGGSQLIPFRNGYLFVVHETIIPDYKNRKYLHRFVWLDDQWSIRMISPTFYIKSLGIEFVSGLAMTTDPRTGVDQLIMSFGYRDRESWLAVLAVDQIAGIMRLVDRPSVDQITAEVMQGSVLMNTTAVTRARDCLVDAGLPLHRDMPKNWDNLKAIAACLASDVSRGNPVLDVGATADSAILAGLGRLGYFDLYSINPDQDTSFTANGVEFIKGDATCTDFANEMFGFISCLSVIEHGVDRAAFFAECARIAKPGARLVVSTDYWHEPIDTAGVTLWNQPLTIFTPGDMAKMIATAADKGFRLLNTFDPTTQEPVIINMGLQYTFACLIFEKWVEV